MSYKTQKHYQENKEEYLERQRRRREEIRDYVLEIKKRSCCKECGQKHVATLCFHHRDPGEKDLAIADIVKNKWSTKRIDKEISKCDVLCSNCHNIIHWEWNNAEVSC